MKNSYSKINRVLKNNLPNSIYSGLYLAYQGFFNKNNIDIVRLKKNASFSKPGFYDFSLENIQFKIFLNPNNGVVDYDIFANGSFEGDILKLFKQELKKDDIFLDIGANIGQHSLYASFFCKHVYSFEPIKRIYDQFSSSILENDIFNISVYNYALGREKESIPIWSSASNMGASSILYSKNKKLEQYVKVVKLDDIYSKAGIERVDFMKIDVEGYEWNVLVGAEEIIKKYRPKILLEFIKYENSQDNMTLEHMYNFIKKYEYEVYDVGSEGGKFSKIHSLEEALALDSTNLFCKQ